MQDQNNSLPKSNILIIDDDATMCLLMKEALPDKTYNITDVNNGLDALKQIKIQQPDLILLDVTMPGMNGFDVCEEIRHLYGDSDISIVMVTALEDSASIEKSYTLGATDFIGKPINWDTFPYRIQYLIKARNAIIAMQQQQLHLEYMEHVSRIITQNKDKNVIMQETMFAMLDIFSADRAILFKPDFFNIKETQEKQFIIDCETTSRGVNAEKGISENIIRQLDDKLIDQANNSVYPIITHYNWRQLPPKNNNTLKQQMLCALHLNDNQKWYLLIQQNSDDTNWSVSDEDTFYKISLRLSNMLSLHLLTEDLSKNETLLKQTQKIGRLGSWNWHALNKTLIWSNEIFRIYGYSKQTFEPDFKRYVEIEFDEDMDRLQLLKELQNNIRTSYQIDHRIRTPDNTIKWVNEQCIGIFSNEGKLLEINGVVQDITDLRIKQDQNVHNSKMESIGQITSGVAHDFGNLMTVAKGNLQFLEESLLESEHSNADHIELLEDTRSAVDDSIELTRQLLSFSRKKPVAPVHVNIKQTLDKFKTLFVKTLGVSIDLSISVGEDLHDILVDPSQFESALLNIIINARNSMRESGSVEIIVDEIKTTKSQHVIHNENNILGERCVCIAITDNGIGMNDEILRRAVEPFYTKNTTNGTGLGLSMVYGFIKQSGGELIIHSALNKGTTIYLQFPFGHGTAKKESTPERAQSLNNIKANILVVEDRDPVRQFAVRCLTQPEITIFQAHNAATARALLKEHTFDLLFTDIVMPGDMNGKKLAMWAKKHHPDLQILLTSAIEKDIDDNTTNKGDLNKNINNHINDDSDTFPLLAKPYSKNELIDNISNLLR